MPQPIERNQPILTVKLDQVKTDGFPREDVALNLKVQERGSLRIRTWLGKKDVFLLQQPWMKPRAYTLVRFRFSPDSPVFALGQPEQFTRIPIPKHLNWPAHGRHRSHKIAIRSYDGPENAPRIAEMELDFSWYLTANAADIVAYMCAEMTRHAQSLSMKLLRQLSQAVQTPSPLEMLPDSGSLSALLPSPRLKMLLKNLTRAWFSWLFRPGNAWFYPHFLHDNFGCWSLDASKGICYRYDIWADILYGYLGHAAGFSASELLTETGLEDAAGGLHDLGMLSVIKDMAQGKFSEALDRFEQNLPLKMQLLSVNERIKRGIPCGKPTYRDTASVRLGIAMWREVGEKALGSEALMLKKLRNNGVPKKFAPEGLPPLSLAGNCGLLG